MVGPLKWYDRDPEGKGRGPGYYYHRGKGRYSKYSRLRDMRYRSRLGKRGRRKWHRPRKVGSGPYRQTRDVKATAKKRKKRRRK